MFYFVIFILYYMEIFFIYIFSVNFVCDINWECNMDKLGCKVFVIKVINVYVLSLFIICKVLIYYDEFRNENKNSNLRCF